ncbi:MAG: MBL fold metallo-hydrolase [Myxococcales bacterium]
MKRVLKILAALLGAALAVVLAFGVVVFVSFSGLAPIQDGQTLPGVQVVKDGIVACYLVDLGSDREVALVDACNDKSGAAVLAALGKRGLGADAVKAILLTHGDKDHTGGVLAFPRAAVLALAADVPLAEGRELRMLQWLFSPKDTGVRVGRALADGEAVDVQGVSFRVFAVPGHTRGSAAFLARGVLFLGDSAETAADGALAPAKRLTSDDLAQNRDSLAKLAQRLASLAGEVTAIAPAHSGVTQKGLAPLSEYAARK